MVGIDLQKFVKTGRLTVVWPNGSTRTYGRSDPSRPDLDIAVRLNAWPSPMRLWFNPDLWLGEAYMEGRLDFERGTIRDLLELVCSSVDAEHLWGGTRVRRLAARVAAAWRQANFQAASQRNVAHHYDLDSRFYRLFLDADMQYSCAVFERPDDTLERAQAEKKRRLADKLQIRDGQRILDIGSGWGGLALSLAEVADVDVLGVTLSKEQLAVARERARQRGLDRRVRFELVDYRDVEGPFDRIVSVGMFEHVGQPFFGTFFETVRKLLAPSGIALVHSIGRAHGPSSTSAFIRKYIFPGGYAPALSEVTQSIEQSGLWLTDVEVLRLHYAQTLAHWQRRFAEARGRAEELYDERFCRMWEFYLAMSEMSFRYMGFMVFQVQLAAQIDAVPLTRDYMYSREAPEADAGAARRFDSAA